MDWNLALTWVAAILSLSAAAYVWWLNRNG